MVRTSMVPRCAYLAWNGLLGKQRRILSLRARGMTQRQVADKLGLDPSTVGQTEKRALHRLSRKMGGRLVNLRELREWDDRGADLSFVDRNGIHIDRNSYKTTAEVAWDHIVDQFLQGAAQLCDVQELAAKMA